MQTARSWWCAPAGKEGTWPEMETAASTVCGDPYSVCDPSLSHLCLHISMQVQASSGVTALLATYCSAMLILARRLTLALALARL